ncbi:MAG: hypothetical protein IRZ16_15305 [Myxococcaceae bacterium]|nr:hypothetical protein [Myxococcaceae bacterium]
MFAFQRMSGDTTVLVVLNLVQEPRRLLLPPGTWTPLAGHGLGDGQVEDGHVALPPCAGFFGGLTKPAG